MKRLMNASIVYGVLGLIGGVFYREFTKLNGFTGFTTLSVVHTHYLMLGMVFFLMLVLLENNFRFIGNKVRKYLLFYHIGLNLTVVMLVVRGVVQVLSLDVSGAAISGIAGIGHLILGISMVLILISIRKKLDV
ncbi:DUF2871 domain-containing protein [uncultured Holdemanella sp.]|uniref:DUF2871 domain-containing protein n=1 Tax=uncultured Holdemanella sp. TaxID=1763549 RepID=UPI0025889376|nr:DUF2871 domain-containing protein [uncultured Holdemanella sp.]